MIILAAIINLIVLRNRKSFVFAGVGIWALIAIAFRFWGVIPAIQWTAVASAIMLLANMLILIDFKKQLSKS